MTRLDVIPIIWESKNTEKKIRSIVSTQYKGHCADRCRIRWNQCRRATVDSAVCRSVTIIIIMIIRNLWAVRHAQRPLRFFPCRKYQERNEIECLINERSLNITDDQWSYNTWCEWDDPKIDQPFILLEPKYVSNYRVRTACLPMRHRTGNLGVLFIS